jgi:hypothetical protein
MRTSLRPLVIAIVPLVLLGAACGSDDDSDTPADTEASSDAPADTEAAGEESSGGNADVEAFCGEVDDFVAAMEELLADPTSGDAAALATQGQELTASAAELAGSVDGSDSERLQECTSNLSEIGN